jgi:hypothetical protein
MRNEVSMKADAMGVGVRVRASAKREHEKGQAKNRIAVRRDRTSTKFDS